MTESVVPRLNRKAISTSISMAFSLFLPTVFTIILLYADLNTNDLCFEWQHHNNTVPSSVIRIRVVGRSVEAVIINLWFPLTAVVLFELKDFKLRFLPVLYIAFTYLFTYFARIWCLGYAHVLQISC